MKPKSNKTLILLILDGWGISPSWAGNAITTANPRYFNYFWRSYPHLVLQAFSKMVGKYNKVGNSEIGHSAIGTGTLPLQDLSKISETIDNGKFFKNDVLVGAYKGAKKHGGAVHLIGLLSDGEIHSHTDHLYALIDLAVKQKIDKLYIHAILDGIDTPPNEGVLFLDRLNKKLKEAGVGQIATVSGRKYAMDRDKHWNLIRMAYRAIISGKSQNTSEHILKTVSQFYTDGGKDLNFPPTVVIDHNKRPIAKVLPYDQLIFFNFRSDRIRQLATAFCDPRFYPWWKTFLPKGVNFVTFADYKKGLKAKVAFPKEPHKICIAKELSDHKLRQFHIAETEKYAHVTYFLNGYNEIPFHGEERFFARSPHPHSYEQHPAGGTPKITQKIISALSSKRFNFIVANLGNVDMVGHTGNIEAVNEAVLAIDEALRKIVEAALLTGAEVMITADHGKVERMLGEKFEDPETRHTLNPVPLIYINPHNKLEKTKLPETIIRGSIISQIVTSEHTLADVAPTILEIFGIKKPKEMTGKSLLEELEKQR